MSYEVGVIGRFTARHRLVGDFGPASQEHAHDYRVEVAATADDLQPDGTALDITILQNALARATHALHGRNLNDLPELGGRNPGLEPFACALAEGLSRALVPALPPRTLTALTVKLWEDEEAFATYTLSFP